ncbi:alkylation response protein AidB-like acyl-CoA dehydrogenase [Streptococcus gallinaceus]|nr:alkylation response protein AidB-like acyl-CoA dehydrogenase [Streptococcus gallinaceus]MCP1770000.1 alkylation response protein AidB-like acyl-CoA dehydrogenase [Streptococcus gallinaceus]
MSYLTTEFIDWLDQHADALNQESGPLADELLEKVAKQGLFKIGVPEGLGGSGGYPTDVIDALSQLAQHSLTAAFISWGHRTFIENILQSENSYGRTYWLPQLLTGQLAAGTGLSNVVKFLSSIEELNVSIVEEAGKLYLQGRLPWVTNLGNDQFVAIFVAGYDDGRTPIVLSVSSTAIGLSRSNDLEFVSLQGSNTASLIFDKVELDPQWIVSDNAPEFLGYQFGLALDWLSVHWLRPRPT